MINTLKRSKTQEEFKDFVKSHADWVAITVLEEIIEHLKDNTMNDAVQKTLDAIKKPASKAMPSLVVNFIIGILIIFVL